MSANHRYWRVVLECGPTTLSFDTNRHGLILEAPPSIGLSLRSSSGNTSSFTFQIPDTQIPQNVRLPGAKATLLLVAEGKERLICQGEVGEYSEGTGDGSLFYSIQVGAQRYRTDLTFPPALIGDRIGDARRFPNAPVDSRALVAPVLYGYVRDVPLVTLDDPETIEEEGVVRMMVAHHAIASQEIAFVLGDDNVPIPSSPRPVLTAIDGLGGLYSYIEVPIAEYAENLYADRVEGYLSGTGGPIHRLGDVLEAMWSQFGKGYDLSWERITRARTALNRFSVGLRFDQQQTQVSLSDVVESRIAGQFPVAFGAPDGRYGWDATLWPSVEAKVSHHIVYDRDMFQSTNLTYPPITDVVNRVAITFQRSGRTGDDTESRSLDATNSQACAASISKWGESPVTQVSLPDAAVVTPDDFSQAWALAEELVRRQGDIRGEITYSFEKLSWLDVPLLTIFSITDLRRRPNFLNRRAALVTKVLRDDGLVDLTFNLLD